MLKSGLTRYTKQSISQANNYSDLSKEEDKHGYKYERI